VSKTFGAFKNVAMLFMIFIVMWGDNTTKRLLQRVVETRNRKTIDVEWSVNCAFQENNSF